jgi:hypothetical protein
MKFEIVPDDGRDRVEQVLMDIWKTKGRTCATVGVFTDDVRKDTNTVESAFKQTHHVVSRLPAKASAVYQKLADGIFLHKKSNRIAAKMVSCLQASFIVLFFIDIYSYILLGHYTCIFSC